MVTERPLGELPVGFDDAGNAEIRFGMDWQSRRGINQRHATPAERPGKGKLWQPFRQRHDGSHGQAPVVRRPSHSRGAAYHLGWPPRDAHRCRDGFDSAGRLPRLHGTDSPPTARGTFPGSICAAGRRGIFGIHLGQRYEGATVARPTRHLRQVVDRCFVRSSPAPHPLGQHVQGGSCGRQVLPRPPRSATRGRPSVPPAA